jgi:hypothetical protein
MLNLPDKVIYDLQMRLPRFWMANCINDIPGPENIKDFVFIFFSTNCRHIFISGYISMVVPAFISGTTFQEV